jgi:hypothetical protein
VIGGAAFGSVAKGQHGDVLKWALAARCRALALRRRLLVTGIFIKKL